MGIMTRLCRIVTADINGVMDQMEDKTLLLRQHLRDMAAALEETRQQSRQLTARDTRLKSQAARLEADIKNIGSDLELALDNQQDDIARHLIRRHKSIEKQLRELHAEQNRIREERVRLDETLRRQEALYAETRQAVQTYAQHHPRTDDVHPATDLKGLIAAIGPSDEEVELELLRRKAARAKGGA